MGRCQELLGLSANVMGVCVCVCAYMLITASLLALGRLTLLGLSSRELKLELTRHYTLFAYHNECNLMCVRYI